MKRYWPVATLVLFILALVLYWNFRSSRTNNQNSTATVSANLVVIGQRTKTSDCQTQGPLQDQKCTPGAVFSSATTDQICKSGYSKTVRNVPTSEKDQVYAEYGISTRTSGEYEVDHLISLELGGSNDIANLWPEAAKPTPGFHEKDQVENYLHQQVCSGIINLVQVQQDIASNWLKYFPLPNH